MSEIRELGSLVLGACLEAAELERAFDAFETLTRILPENLPAARERIASRVFEAGGYAL